MWAGLQGAHRKLKLQLRQMDLRAAFSPPNPQEALNGLTKDKSLLCQDTAVFITLERHNQYFSLSTKG